MNGVHPMPTISIIVPVYNVEPYLRRCVDSILAQTFTDFELILVDDGSPDNCGAICDEYAEKDSRIHVIHQENGGLSAARNAGIDYAHGEYLCFVDSDDLLSAEYCRLLLDALAHTNRKIAACSMLRFEEESVLPPQNNSVTLGNIKKMPYALFLKKQMNKEIEIGVCNKLFHRSVFTNIRFMQGKLHEDIIFAGDLLTEVNCDVVHVDIPLYFYRQHTDSIMNQQSNARKCNPDRIYAGNYLIECAKKAKYSYLEDCLFYAINYPWYFVDPIYVRFRFAENQVFLNALQKIIRDNRELYRNLPAITTIQRKRMLLFSRSKILYSFNAYVRLFRVYLYHLLKKDAYADGHGI